MHELTYSRQRAGVQLSDSANGRYGSVLSMGYLDLKPANLNYSTGRIGFYTGPYFGALLHAHALRKDETGALFKDRRIYGEPGDNEAGDKYLQKFDFGWNLGFDYGFPFGLAIGGNYALGINDIFQYANSYTLEDPKNGRIKVYNRSFTLRMVFNIHALRQHPAQ